MMMLSIKTERFILVISSRDSVILYGRGDNGWLSFRSASFHTQEKILTNLLVSNYSAIS